MNLKVQPSQTELLFRSVDDSFLPSGRDFLPSGRLEPSGRRGVMERMEREKPDDVASAGFRNAIDFAWSHAAGKFKQLRQTASSA